MAFWVLWFDCSGLFFEFWLIKNCRSCRNRLSWIVWMCCLPSTEMQKIPKLCQPLCLPSKPLSQSAEMSPAYQGPYLVLIVVAILVMRWVLPLDYLTTCLLPVCRTAMLLHTCLYQPAHGLSSLLWSLFSKVHCFSFSVFFRVWPDLADVSSGSLPHIVTLHSLNSTLTWMSIRFGFSPGMFPI